MAATQYQIFFRYVNPASNVAITNDLINDYEETVEIIHGKHKLEYGTNEEKADAEQEINNMIIEANSPSLCNKYDMIFVYDGIKKYYHKNWVPGTPANDVTGTEAEYGHWTGDITLMPTGVIVRKDYDLDAIIQDVIKVAPTDTSGNAEYLVTDTVLQEINTDRTAVVTDLREAAGMVPNYLKPESYITEDESQYPYVVKDCYKRVPMSPWIKGSVFGSLDAAIEKCKVLTKAIGLNNIMLIKTVAIRQKIKLN